MLWFGLSYFSKLKRNKMMVSYINLIDCVESKTAKHGNYVNNKRGDTTAW